MSIKIKIPTKKGPSNKADIDPKNPPTAPVADQPDLPYPFIDKISILVKPPTDADRSEIYTAVIAVLDDHEYWNDDPKAKAAGFSCAKRLLLPSIVAKKKRPLIWVRWNKDQKLVTEVRLEFVPADLGPQGMEELSIYLTSIMNDGWSYVVKHGTVTRIDVAVDLPSLTMDSIHFLPKKAAHTQHWLQNGQLETIYIGRPKSNQIAIYERGTKRKKQGQEWPWPPSVRIERRLKNLGGLKLSALPSMKNPFVNTSLTTHLPGPPNLAKAWEWSLFADSVSVRGLAAALALLPDGRRTQYRKHVEAHASAVWQPEQFWKLWKPMLAELKIASSDW